MLFQGKMKFAGFRYDFSSNLGDQIQSIAAEQFIPQPDNRFDRDLLHEVAEIERFLMIMQGWFSITPQRCFPPSGSIAPIFYGFHIADIKADANHFLNRQSIAYFKKHSPVGCRDRYTARLLQERGVDAFYSKCLTLTFPTRTSVPANGKVIIVDVNPLDLPATLVKNALIVTHAAPQHTGEEEKRILAQRLLDLYRDEAKLVITKRLHCALPCIAMGIPVIFFGKKYNTRTSIIADLNVPVYAMPYHSTNPGIFFNLFGQGLHSKNRLAYHENNDAGIDWNPKPIDVENEKQQIIERLKTMLKQAESNYIENDYPSETNIREEDPDDEVIAGSPDLDFEAGSLQQPSLPEMESMIRKSSLFDPVFYLRRNPDVQASGMDPLEHYCIYGGREGRDPGPEFDGEFYFRNHPGLKQRGVNPLIHHLQGKQK